MTHWSKQKWALIALAYAGLTVRSVAVNVRFASHPLAANANLDPMSLPAYDAVARHLMADKGSRK